MNHIGPKVESLAYAAISLEDEDMRVGADREVRFSVFGLGISAYYSMNHIEFRIERWAHATRSSKHEDMRVVADRDV